MEQEKINICDRCHTRVSTRKCFICGSDLCNYCGIKTDYFIGYGINLKYILDYCSVCSLKLKHIIEKEEKEEGVILDSLKKCLTDDLTKRLVLWGLK